MKADQHGANVRAASRMLGHFILHDRSPLLVPGVNCKQNIRPEEVR